MRVLVNAVGARMGGAARHLVPFLDALSTRRPHWELIVCLGKGDGQGVSATVAREIIEATGTSLLSRLWWDFSGASALAGKRDADVILGLTNYGPFRPDGPSVLFQRNSIYFDPCWVGAQGSRFRAVAAARRRLAFAELATSTAVVTPTRAMLAYLRSWPSARLPQKARVVMHGVDVSRFALAERRDAPRADALRLLCVTHAAPHKGLETAVSCLAHLQRLGIDAHLSLTIGKTGNGSAQSYVNKVLRQAARDQVADRIDWLGSQREVESLYRDADAMLFPSSTESFGFPLVEAMASGTPIVASAIPSSIEVAGPAADYFVPGDAKTAAAHVASLVGVTTSDAQERSVASRARAESMSWAANAESVAVLLEEVTAE